MSSSRSTDGSEQLLNTYIFLFKFSYEEKGRDVKKEVQRESCREGTPMYTLQVGEDQPSPWTFYCSWQSIQTTLPWGIGVFIHDDQRLLVTEGELSPCVGVRSKPAVLQTCSTNALPVLLPASQLAATRQVKTSPFFPLSTLLSATLLTWPMLVMVRAWGLDMPQAEAKTLDSADLIVPVCPQYNWSRTKMTKNQGRAGTSMPQRDICGWMQGPCLWCPLLH